MDKTIFDDRYSDLVLRKGLNFQPSQKLLIVTSFDCYPFARLLAQKAYNLGAQYVHIDVLDSYIQKERIQYSNLEDLDYLPGFLGQTKVNEFLAEDWVRVRIDNPEENHVLENVSTDKLQRLTKKSAQVNASLLRALGKDLFSWCVICYPTHRWASDVLHKPLSEEVYVEFLHLLSPILRIEEANYLERWDKHNEMLQERRSFLNEKKIQELIFRDKGTELSVSLLEDSLWQAATGHNSRGLEFWANLPSEEVYTTPDCNKTHGRVEITFPVKVLEALVEGAWFEFEKGKVVRCGASKNEDYLKKFIEIDEGASMIGEIALVDSTSPIAQTHRYFNTILYDENASCHFALGQAYLSCLKHPRKYEDEKKKISLGCNSSLVHKDFMMSSPETSVIARDGHNHYFDIIKQGKFVL